MAEVKFQLDEHLDSGIVRALRRERIDVVTTREANLLSMPDEAHIAHAVATGRVILTQDRDFLRFHHRGVPHSGIAYCAQGSRTIREIVEGLLLIRAVYRAEEMVGRLEWL